MQHASEEISRYLSTIPARGGGVREVENTCCTCKRAIEDGVINYVHGGYDLTNMRTIIKPCPTCSNDVAIQLSARRESEAVARVFGGAQIPWRSRDWSFDNYPVDADQHARIAVQNFVQRHLAGDQTSKRMLYLGGATGRCKTSLSLCALKEALAAGESGLYVITAKLMVMLQSSFRLKDTPEDTMLNAISSVRWLVLDDLAVESGTDARVSAHTLKSLYLIIQERADKGLYTIVNSNLSLKDLEIYWRPATCVDGQFHEGVRIIERLREYCEGVSVAGRNQRG